MWVALMAVVVLLSAALAIDGGQAYQSGRQSQNAADAGSLAGMRVLANLSLSTNVTATYDQIRTEILKLSGKSGSDTDTGKVQCWLIRWPTEVDAFNPERISPGTDSDGNDMCTQVYDNSAIQTWAEQAGGVEVRTTATRKTNFARAAGFAQTTAARRAKAYAFGLGGLPTPFVICGVRPTSTPTDTSYAYKILDPTDYHIYGSKQSPPLPPAEADTYDALRFTAGKNDANGDGVDDPIVDPTYYGRYKYYTIQDAQIPRCGSKDANFKGSGDGAIVPKLPGEVGIVPGNGIQSYQVVAVAGMRTCTQADFDKGQLNGCALLIPIADYNVNSGTYHAVKYVAFYVWGQSKGTYPWNSVVDDNGFSLGTPGAPVGGSCRNAYQGKNAGGQPQFCGRVLQAFFVTDAPRSDTRPGRGDLINVALGG